jgi:hypothetical protein
MRLERKLAAAAGAACFLVSATLPALAVTSSPQVRHLVYSFTWGTTNTTEVHTSGMGSVGNPTGAGGMSDHGSASGMSSASGGTSDRGTISVDVVRQQSDGGLVVNVSEQAIEHRSAPAATCVVYGDLTIVCDPNKTINEEELALLRFLGASFVDPSAIDAKRHWQRVQSGASTTSTSDFTIAKNADGVMTIDETRVEKATGSRPLTSDITGIIVYDFNRTLPTSVTEATTMRSEQGEQYQTVQQETTLQLQSDSSAHS